jgi:tetratricopeptide (TPR) repeat protein
VTYRSYLILQYVREGKRDEARKELDELLRRRGSDGGATEKLFTICRDERAVDEGLEICGSLVRIQGEKPGLMVEMGRLYLVKGEDKNAERSFNKAVFIDPRCFAAYIELGLVAEKSGRPSEAAALYRRVIEIEPGSLFARRMYASALVSGGKKDEAISIYEELLRRYPDSPEVLCALAALYGERKERSREAMKLALRAREIAPRSAGAIDALGWLYVKEGKYPVALPLLEEGARLHPKDPSILYHLGMACYESGNITCARKYLTECLKVGGEFDGAENARRIISGM